MNKDLREAAAALDDARTAIANRLEQHNDPDTVVALMRARQFINAALQAVQSVPAVLCNNRFGFSQRCVLERGHAGQHSNGIFGWDDSESVRSQNGVVETMKGRTE